VKVFEVSYLPLVADKYLHLVNIKFTRVVTSSCKLLLKGEVQVMFLKDFFKQHWIESLAESAWSSDFARLGRIKDDIRGPHICVDLGQWQERGGSGKYFSTPNMQSFHARNFVTKHNRVWKAVRAAMCFIDPSFVEAMSKSAIPALFANLFTYCVVNLTSTSKLHRDNKDYKWCCLIQFGKFVGGALLLPFLGFEFPLQSNDLIVFDSYAIHHQILKVLQGTRGSVVLTSQYTAVVGEARWKKNRK